MYALVGTRENTKEERDEEKMSGKGIFRWLDVERKKIGATEMFWHEKHNFSSQF